MAKKAKEPQFEEMLRSWIENGSDKYGKVEKNLYTSAKDSTYDVDEYEYIITRIDQETGKPAGKITFLNSCEGFEDGKLAFRIDALYKRAKKIRTTKVWGPDKPSYTRNRERCLEMQDIMKYFTEDENHKAFASYCYGLEKYCKEIKTPAQKDGIAYSKNALWIMEDSFRKAYCLQYCDGEQLKEPDKAHLYTGIYLTLPKAWLDDTRIETTYNFMKAAFNYAVIEKKIEEKETLTKQEAEYKAGFEKMIEDIKELVLTPKSKKPSDMATTVKNSVKSLNGSVSAASTKTASVKNDVKASKPVASKPVASKPASKPVASKPAVTERDKFMYDQFLDLKKNHQEHILLLLDGEFYRLFDQDAKDAADVLGITLVKRDGRDEAGFPAEILDTYLPKLIRAGKLIAICNTLDAIKPEQPKTDESKVEEPKTDEPKTEEPKAEKPKTPKASRPKAPKASKPKTPKTPKAGQPKPAAQSETSAEPSVPITDIQFTDEQEAVVNNQKQHKQKELDPREQAMVEKFAAVFEKKLGELTNKDRWEQPWFTTTTGCPRNINGRAYNLYNSLMLLMECEDKGWRHPVFLTFEQCLQLNVRQDKDGNIHALTDKDGNPLPKVSVNKGEKSTYVIKKMYIVINKETREKISMDAYKKMSPEEQKNYFLLPRQSFIPVFNVAQTNIQEARPDLWAKIDKSKVDVNNITETECVFPEIDYMIVQDKWECPIRLGGNSAFWTGNGDYISIPAKDKFKDHRLFYGTLLHEMTHSTGSANRLMRNMSGRFGSYLYGREELIAEITAALVCQTYGIQKEISKDSLTYVKSWLKSMKEDDQFITNVLMDVARAANYIGEHIDEIADGFEDGRYVRPECTDGVQAAGKAVFEEIAPTITISAEDRKNGMSLSKKINMTLAAARRNAEAGAVVEPAADEPDTKKTSSRTRKPATSKTAASKADDAKIVAKPETKPAAKPVAKPASTAIEFVIEDYSERAIIVKGDDAMKYKDEFSLINAVVRRGVKGYILSKRRRGQAEKLIELIGKRG